MATNLDSLNDMDVIGMCISFIRNCVTKKRINLKTIKSLYDKLIL